MPTQKIYSDINYAKWFAIRTTADTYGIHLADTHGQQEAIGARFSWEWLKTKRTLKIEILDGGIWGDENALLFVDGLIQNALSTVPADE